MLVLPPIDRDSRTPPNRQIAAALIADIKAGRYEPGQRLPGRDDIVGATGVNRSTALKALRFVAEEGYAELSIGLGYFVTDRGTSGAHGSDSP